MLNKHGEEIKETGMGFVVKDWFMYKEFSSNEQYVVGLGEQSLERETEKAVLLKWSSDFGSIKKWVPKSCLETIN